MEWYFRYQVNGSGWTQYQTSGSWWRFWDKKGCGNTIDLAKDDYVEVNEFDVSGWHHTTAKDYSFHIEKDKVVVVTFGNATDRVGEEPTPTEVTPTVELIKPQVLAADPPEKAPETGFSVVSYFLVGIASFVILLIL